MKIKLTLLFILLVIIGCKDKNELSHESVTFKSENCNDCPKVLVDTYNFKGDSELASIINNTLQEEIIDQLIYDDEIIANTVEEAITSFKKGFLALKEMYPDESLGWEAKIKTDITFENKDVISIKLDTYIFTGGAHGFSASKFLNFDKKKGNEFENWKLFNDKGAFTHFVETKFKIQEDIPQNSSINSTGFMFEGDIFYLPSNIGFTDKGLQLIYNQYEVASYADGPIVITLPYNEIKKYLSVSIKK
ncbi:DUF4163 domain-containing protein [Cellulophaga sp. HaHaR_3_176]|uniref:DUF3298 and DUF4163 domain-containing protein n=1 Tax=Cellulophaga sp. HaHaR_3_176 TaxID=1942464 RepID=UPI001C1FD069|nr:DUF3298 and DUF4163 domain-containing protein [Cellulophaga sp. HaHaR_3_176]QWX83400.1 DUF4163 domain-containing protein [Cellulophaga sp. HaHaR_3_176]